MPHRFQKWRDALHAAPDAKSVSAVAREYVDAIGMPIIGALPVECQRMLTQPTLDVQATAVTLLQAELSYKGSEEARTLLHEVAHTFAAAAVRLTMLHGKPQLTAD